MMTSRKSQEPTIFLGSASSAFLRASAASWRAISATSLASYQAASGTSLAILVA